MMFSNCANKWLDLKTTMLKNCERVFEYLISLWCDNKNGLQTIQKSKKNFNS